VQYGTEHQIV
jgi:hypothetical protein